FPIKALHYHNIPWITKGGIDFLDSVSASDKPFFLYIAPTAIHGPNHQENLTEDLKYTVEGYVPEVAQYQPDSLGLIEAASTYSVVDAHRFAGIAHIDHQVGLLVEDLKAKGIYESTAIIFMADHNIEPGKATCYHKGTNVPLIIKWPGTKQGVVSDALVSNVDILPTLVTAAGADRTPGLSSDGADLTPLLTGAQSKIRDHTFSEAGYTRSVFDGRFKYIALRFPQAVNESIKNGGLVVAPNHLNVPRQAHSRIASKYHQDYFDGDQLYDIQTDPYEQNNLANDPKFADDLRRLQSVLQQQVASFDHPFDLEDATLSSAHYQKLIVKAREAIDLSDIAWFMRDHGRMVWPPEE
ncbi:MAG: sulfatase-like hydrolase/transferase, partial [Bacteroidota bacterium]